MHGLMTFLDIFCFSHEITRQMLRGKGFISDDLRSIIIDTKFLIEDGDVATGISQTSFRTLGRRYEVSSNVMRPGLYGVL